jgi:hypothetical protein
MAFGVGRSLEQSFDLIEVLGEERGDFREIVSLIKVVWLPFQQ